MALTKAEILALDDWTTKELNVKHWGLVYIRTLTAKEGNRFEQQAAQGAATRDDFYAKAAVLFLSDDNGNRLFDDSDVDALNHKSLDALKAVVEAGMKLNGYTSEEIDELEKNSETTQPAGSSSV